MRRDDEKASSQQSRWAPIYFNLVIERTHLLEVSDWQFTNFDLRAISGWSKD